MKAETVKYFIPQSVRLTGKQLTECHKSWMERWGRENVDELTDEDLLIEAELLGFVELPEGWKV